MEFFIIIAWLVLCGAAAAYADNKGRSGRGTFFLSLFLSPLVGFLVAVVMEPNQQKVAEAKGMKKCPECAEFVQADAKICRFCRHEFPTIPDQPVNAAVAATNITPPVVGQPPPEPLNEAVWLYLRGAIGVVMVDTNDGVILTTVVTGSPSERAGLKVGDRILAVDGEKVNNRDMVIAEVASTQPGSPLNIRISRAGVESTVVVTVPSS